MSQEYQDRLRKLAFKGLKNKGFEDNQEYIDRLEYELKVIADLGFDPYFLVVEDICHFTKENFRVVSPGRGSVGSSLLAYCLDITMIDPIKYGLEFARFLNPNRVSPPDIDLDFADRDKIIEYIEETYGKDRVARVGSLNFLRTKSCIRDICRVLEKPYAFADELAKIVPPPVAGLWDSFEKETEIEPRLLDEKYAEIIGPTSRLWGVTRSYGTHAGGVVIAPGPINQYVPLYKDKDGNAVTQFDYRDLEKTGLLKLDILGLKTMAILEFTLQLIEEKGESLDLQNLKDEDKETYDLICSGDLEGIFQLGGEGIKNLTVSIAPRCIEDLSIILSTFRPGPLSSGLADDLILVRQGKKKPSYQHPLLEPILEETHSVPVYQEQVARICVDLAGYSIPRSMEVMKFLSKKKKEKLKAEKPIFIKGATKKGVPRDVAEKIFSSLEDYAQYLFNKIHSVSYAFLTYRTAYVKAHYPLEFWAATLDKEKNPDKIIKYTCAIKEAGIEILPPDVNKSRLHHYPEGNAIRFGLGHIKGMPQAMAKAIVEERDRND